MQFIRKLYTVFLYLYPKKYREEYGDELRTVFNLSLDEMLGKAGMEIAWRISREFLSLPKAILHEHLRERRKTKMMKSFASRFDFALGSRNETRAALIPFLFGSLMILFSYISYSLAFPMWMQVTFVFIFWLLLISLFVIGFAKGAPRWFMPYLGLPLPIISLIIFNSWLDDWIGIRFNRLYERSWFMGQFVFQGLLWVGLIGSILLLVLTVSLIPKFHPFYNRLKNDWTLLCFILYGAMPFVLVLTFDEYKYGEPYMFLAFLILAAGGWFYLRNDELWKKFLCLYIGVALSMLTAVVGKAIILPIQEWPVFIDPSYWKSEAMSTLVTWMWLALVMLIPPALTLLPRSDDSPQAI